MSLLDYQIIFVFSFSFPMNSTYLLFVIKKHKTSIFTVNGKNNDVVYNINKGIYHNIC